MNSDFGHLHLVDYFVIFYCIFRVIGKTELQLESDFQACYTSAQYQHIAWELPVFFLTYPFIYPDTTSTSFAITLQHFLIRTYVSQNRAQQIIDCSRTNYLLNPASLRFLTRPPSEHVTTILSSPRYSRFRENINYQVERPDFTGYWILRHSLKSPKAPSSSDLTILFLHGGGYFTSLPAHYLLFLLRLAESILEQGVSVSIFALDYSLAPEHVFPTQLDEATAAYRYLISEEQIPAGKIVVMGDSAGGHLALSLLVHLNKMGSLIEEKALEKPGGLVMMSPWLSLHHESTSFTTNAHKDVLSRPFLRLAARRFLGHDLASRESPAAFDMNSPYLEFLSPRPTIEWNVVLPS
ncbi:MAG: hypothetical protein Q9161_007206 [Pseudevernia consocians]